MVPHPLSVLGIDAGEMRCADTRRHPRTGSVQYSGILEKSSSGPQNKDKYYNLRLHIIYRTQISGAVFMILRVSNL